MKRFLLMVSLIVAMLVVMPNVKAADAYYNVSYDQSEWTKKDDGSYYINKIYYVEKTVNGYVYLKLIETNNVKITASLAGSNFTIVNETREENGISYLLKVKDGVNVSGKTEAITVTADIVDASKKECQLDYSPLGLSCMTIDDHYFDKDSKEVTEEEAQASCEGVTPSNPNDVPSPDTGSVIPYIAIGGGLVAIAGVYLYSRKSNKVYKI